MKNLFLVNRRWSIADSPVVEELLQVKNPFMFFTSKLNRAESKPWTIDHRLWTTRILITLLLSIAYTASMGQIRSTTSLNTQVKTTTDLEKIKIPFTQSPLLHDDGGWEKGPSLWTNSSKYPVSYRGGLLLLDRKTNGMVRYISINIRFKQTGSIEVTANSSGSTSVGFNTWKFLYGKEGQEQTLTFITKEAEFGREINLYLKNFKPYQHTQVN